MAHGRVALPRWSAGDNAASMSSAPGRKLSRPYPPHTPVGMVVATAWAPSGRTYSAAPTAPACRVLPFAAPAGRGGWRPVWAKIMGDAGRVGWPPIPFLIIFDRQNARFVSWQVAILVGH
jgi:hypothetical protein